MPDPNEQEDLTQGEPSQPTGQAISRRHFYMKQDNGKWTQVGAPEPNWFGQKDTSVKEYEETTYSSGEIWLSEFEDGQKVSESLVDMDPQLSSRYNAQKKQEGDNWLTGSTSTQFLIRQKPDGSIEQIPNPNYQAPRAPAGPQAPQLAPRYADEAEYSRLRNEKMRRELQNQFARAQQEAYEAIQDIQQRVSRGEIDVKEADRLIGLVKQSTEAALMGASPFQMQQADRSFEQSNRQFGFQQQQQQQNLASDVMGRRMQTSSSMAQGLMSGLLGAFGKVRSGNNPSYDFNPLQMAQSFTNDVGGGQEMNDLARAILMGALRGGNNG